MDMDGVQDRAEGAAREVGDSRIVEYGARTGFAASGVLHLLMAWIAVRIAWSNGGGSADQSGALGDLADQPGGRVLLWVVVAGFVLLAVWRLTEAVTGSPGADAKDRAFDAVSDTARAIMFVALAWAAYKFASGGSSSSGQGARDFTGTLMEQPFGRVLVAVVGLVILGVGVYHGYKGWTEGFRDDLQEHPGATLMTIGRIGYIAKGIALGIVVRCSSSVVPKAARRTPPGSTARCARCWSSPSGRGCSPWSPSASPATASTRWRVPGSRRSDRRSRA